MIVRFAPPTCLLAAPCIQRPETMYDEFDPVWQEIDKALASERLVLALTASVGLAATLLVLHFRA